MEQLITPSISEKSLKYQATKIAKWQVQHGNRYDYSKVIFVGDRVKVVIGCSKHGGFEQTPNDHSRGHGCLRCWQENRNRRSTESFIEAARGLHGTTYDYSKVEYFSARIKVTIICPVHGEIRQLPSNHLQGHGCHKCAHLKRSV